MTIIGVGLLWLSGIMVYGVIEEIQMAQEYPEYWDLWFFVTILFITLIVLALAVLVWYETWLKPILDRDRAYNYVELVKQFDAISKPTKNETLYLLMFNELPYRKRKKILIETMEVLK